jgi:hypothetical protein
MIDIFGYMVLGIILSGEVFEKYRMLFENSGRAWKRKGKREEISVKSTRNASCDL